MTAPYLADPDFTLFVGDVRDVLPQLPDESVDCVVTSPPYFALRDYSAEGQLGLEATVEEYLEQMVEVFREIRRLLAPMGTAWVNLGDTYARGKSGRSDGASIRRVDAKSGRRARAENYAPSDAGDVALRRVPGLKEKELVGVPWHVAFALQADGWFLRSEIIWAKNNPMPESVTDRPTKSHETIFLLTKQPRYYFDQEAAREPFSGTAHGRGSGVNPYADSSAHVRQNASFSGSVSKLLGVPPPQYETLDGMDGEAPRGPDGRRQTRVKGRDGSIQHRDGERWPNAGRNMRTVWEIPTQPYQDAHFATYPEELVRRCIAAGCPEWVCRICGRPRERLTDVEYSNPGNRSGNGRQGEEWRDRGVKIMSGGQRLEKHIETLGWSECDCIIRCPTGVACTGCRYCETAWEQGKWRPGVVLDPFMGSGTTAYVARKLARHAVGIELSSEYALLIARRLSQQSLFAGEVA